MNYALRTWGSHPRLRMARTNTGAGWFARGTPARKTDPGAYPVKFGTPGTGDIVGLVAPTGRLFMLELKTLRGVKRKAQVIMQRVVRSMGGAYEFARTEDQVDAFFRGLL